MYSNTDLFRAMFPGEILTDEEIQQNLDNASVDIDGLTFNHIIACGVENLTEFQQLKIFRAVCRQAKFRIDINNDLKLNCADRMLYIDNLFTVTKTKRTLHDIMCKIAVTANCLFSTTPSQIYLLSKSIDDSVFQGYSNRQVMSLIASACGSFAICNYDGNFEFKWFTASGIELRGDWAVDAISLNGNTFSVDGNPVKVTGVNILTGDEVVYQNGTSEFVLELNDNPVADAYPNDTANFILNRMSGTVYIPCSWKRIGGDPSIQVGDILTVIDNKERYDETKKDTYTKYKLFLSQKSWSYNSGGFSDTYEAESYKAQSGKKGMTVSKRVSQLRKQVSDIQNNISSELNDRQQALLLFNEKMYASMGLHQTIKTDADGGIITYLHDETTLESSKTIYKFSAGGFAWTTSGWNGGNPVWTSGIADNGDAILNQIYAYVISADLIKTGLLKSQNGASWIDMDDGTFCFRYIDGKYYKTALELNNKVLNVYGTLKSLIYTSTSISIGKSESGDFGSFSVTDTNYGDLFQVYPVSDSAGAKGTVWTAPFLINAAKSNRKGISVFPNNIFLFADDGDIGIRGGNARLYSQHDTFSIGNNMKNEQWINYYPLDACYTPSKFLLGNGTQGGLAGLKCGAIYSSADIGADNDIYSMQNLKAKKGIYAYEKVSVGMGDSFFSDNALSVTGNTMITGNIYNNGNISSAGSISSNGNVTVKSKISAGCGDNGAQYTDCNLSVIGKIKTDEMITPQVTASQVTSDNILSNQSVTAKNQVVAYGDIKTAQKLFAYDKASIGMGDEWYQNYTLSVGGSCCASAYDVSSDRSKKINIIEQNSVKALDKISKINFYSYDFVGDKKEQSDTISKIDLNSSTEASSDTSKSAPVHIDMGIMADEAPTEIQGSDGKSINLYSYTSLCAKAIQELTAELTACKAEIAELKEKIGK